VWRRVHVRFLPPRRTVFELCYAALALLSVLPLWAVERPPIQDLPQHLAAVRVLHDYADPGLRFSEFFDVALSRTQYLTYYLAVHLLAYPFGVVLANKLLLSAAMIGTPYAMRALLAAAGRDERGSLFVFPLTYNAHLVLGFLNFVTAIPLALAIVIFYTHVVPFGLFALGAVMLAIDQSWRASLSRLLTLLPAAIAAVVWAGSSPAGQSVLMAAGVTPATARGPQYQAWGEALRAAPDWLTDVLHSHSDDRRLVLWGVLVLCTLVVSVRSGQTHPEHADDALRERLARRVALLCPIAVLAYFIAPASYDWIWPINARFPLLAALFAIVILPSSRSIAQAAIYAGVAAMSLVGFVDVLDAFRRFERREVLALGEAIESIPRGSKVAGLIYDRQSKIVKFSPFIHAAAWYQVERGGAVMFTFADFPQSPVVFKADNRPPRVPPRWEWLPQNVNLGRDLDWYDYVLVRGSSGRLAMQPSKWEPIFDSQPWSVWRRRS
jgi:hypothetical protein